MKNRQVKRDAAGAVRGFRVAWADGSRQHGDVGVADVFEPMAEEEARRLDKEEAGKTKSTVPKAKSTVPKATGTVPKATGTVPQAKSTVPYTICLPSRCHHCVAVLSCASVGRRCGPTTPTCATLLRRRG
jgi:hypothetical protein